MNTFEVGEVVEVVCPESDLHGEDVVVERFFGPSSGNEILTTWGWLAGVSFYEVSHRGRRAWNDGTLIAFLPSQLRKKRPPEEYDGNETTTWDKCVFKPREMVRV